MLCPRCGAPATPADKFCAVCASPLAPSGPGAFGAPPPPPPPPFPAPGFGSPPEPPPNYGSPSGGFGPPPPAPFGAPPPAPPGFGPPPEGVGSSFGPPPPFGSQPGGYGAPQPPPPVPLKPPPFPPEPPVFGAPGGGYGPAPSFPEQQQGGYPGPPRPGFGPPPQQQGARCVQGHAIPPGGSFCMEGGHPIALDGIQMSGDPFNQTAYPPNQPGPSAPPPVGQMGGQLGGQMGGGGMGPYGEPPPPPPHQGMPLPAPPPPPQYISAPPIQRQPTPAPPRGQESRRMLAGFLVSFQDDTLGRFWPLWQGKNVIGRAETGQKVDIEIAHGTTSTHHATIEIESGRLVLADLGSTNGTFHNEEAIGFQGRRELRDGDKIRFGGFSVILFSVAARA
ncbi:FHA domain-containing protein [Sorangium sp. So ce136]|uniref:FHA domain-containing protein n=1 Tax=Sorangium sp. So ce136 TaxID=3133284 RepID=UPI003F10E726